MRRCVLIAAAIAAIPVAAARGAEDDVSVTITGGPGVVLQGAPTVDVGVDGRLSLDFEGVQVVDTSGSGAGWTLQARAGAPATVVAGEGAGTLDAALMELDPGDTVMLTAAPAAL